MSVLFFGCFIYYQNLLMPDYAEINRIMLQSLKFELYFV